MLQYIRERAQGLLALLIIGFIIFSFALWGIQEYLNAGSDSPAAEVNGASITKERLQTAVNQQRQRYQEMLGANYRPEMFAEATLKQAMLNGLVEREVLVQAAIDAGLRVSDEQLAEIIRSIPDFQVDGQFSQEAYTRTLRLQGYTTQAFENELRRDLLVGQLRAGVAASGFTTPYEANEYLRLQNQKRDFGYLLLPVSKFKAAAQVSDAEIREHYEANRSSFMEPEKVRVAYVELSVAELARDVSVNDEQVRAYYESHPDDFRKPEERKARHILFRVPSGADAAADQKARAQAEAALAKLRGGADFAALAKELSEDPGSAKQGGDLGYFPRGVMDKAFEEVVFSLDAGKVSEPVRSAFGYHLIQVQDVRGGELAALAQIREEIRARLREEKARERFYELADQLGNLAYEHPDTLQPIAEQLGLSIKQSDYFAQGQGTGVLTNPKVAAAVFSEEVLERGNNSEPVDVSTDHLVVVRVLDRRPAAQRPLEDVRQTIADNLRQEKARAAAVDAARKAQEALAAGQTDPAAYAKRVGGEWKRQSAARGEQGVPRTVVQTAFSMPKPGDKPTVARATVGEGDQAVVLLFGVQEGQGGDTATVASQLERANAEALYEGVVATLRKKADVQISKEQL